MIDLHELEAIKRLKHKYLRCLDEKLWDEMETVFTEDATAAYSGGKYSFTGRDKILEFLRQVLGPPTMLTSHRASQPEIDFTSDTTATGIWAFEDTVIETGSNITIRGAAFYRDEYVKVDGQWRIKATGYTRTFEEMRSRGDTPSLKLTANRWSD